MELLQHLNEHNSPSGTQSKNGYSMIHSFLTTLSSANHFFSKQNKKGVQKLQHSMKVFFCENSCSKKNNLSNVQNKSVMENHFNRQLVKKSLRVAHACALSKKSKV